MLIHPEFQSHKLLESGQMLERDMLHPLPDQGRVLFFLFLCHLPARFRIVSRSAYARHILQEVPGVKSSVFHSFCRKLPLSP